MNVEHASPSRKPARPEMSPLTSRRSFLAATTLLGGMFLHPLRTHAAETAATIAPEAAKTAPACPPQRVTLSCAGDLARSVNVTWRTCGPVEAAQGQIAPLTAAPRFEDAIRKVPAELFTFATESGDTAFQYNLSFSDLDPGSQYCFRVGDGHAWSEWNTFQTATDKPEPFSFLYIGDVQNDIRSLCSRAVRSAFRQAPDTRFVLCAGDLVNRGYEDGLWGEFSEAFGFLAQSVPCLPTPGNHDTKRPENGPEPEAPYTAAPAYHGHFNLPKNGPKNAHILNGEAYYVDCQGVRVISINSNVFDDEAPTNAAHKQALDAQLAWLEETLANNPNRWTVLTHHHPIYSVSNNRDNPGLRALLRPLYDKYKVDLVLQGHDHAYGRTHKLANDRIVDPAASGTVYAVSVLGPKMYPVKCKHESLMACLTADKQLFQVVHVDSNTLSYTCRGIDGQIVDAFELKKDEAGNSTYLPMNRS